MQCESCGHDNIDGARFCASCGLAIVHKSDENPWIGKLVGGRFRITRVLGEGGMGIVFAAEQQMGSSVRRVAIKTLHPHLSQDPSVLARFHRECGTVSQLEHPNTIKVYDFGAETDGTLYIAMEFVEGKSLDKVIDEEGALSPHRVVNIMRQICGALDEAHNIGIVHRDLKPENVVLGEKLGKSDFVKLLDFGIAARRESADAQKEQKLTQQGMVLGTPPYMSPEQFTGQELDRRSDVYSLGIMAYEMLTSRLPFNAQTPWQWATEHMTAQPFPIDQIPSGQGVPRSMRDAVMKALAKDPNQRPATAGAFLAELEEGVAGHSSVAPQNTARTEAMQAAPVFSKPATGEAPVPSGYGGREGTQDGIASTQAIEIPVKKSKVGLFVGLAAALAAAGGLVFALRGNSGATEGSGGTPAALASALPSAAPSTAASVAPSATSPVVEPLPSASSSTTEPTATPTTPKPTPTTPKPTPTVVVPPKPVGPTAEECVAQVTAGSWSKATATFSKLDTTGQGTCRTHARREAVTQVTSAGKDCKKVKSVAAGAKAMGASSPRVDKALAECK